MNVHSYKLDGTYIGTKEINTNDAKVSQHLRAALNGYKGYGYYNGEWVSKQQVSIMNAAQTKRHFDAWVTSNLNRIEKQMKRKYKEWCDDCWQDAILYVYECALSDRGVNDPENSLGFKYANTLKDAGRKRTVKSKYELGDKEVWDSDFEQNRSYIDTFAMESMTMDDQDRCTIDLNNEEKFRITIQTLLNHFDRHQINVWANYYMYDQGVRKRGESFGYAGTAKRSGLSKSGVRDIVKLIDEKIVELELKDDMLKQYVAEKYRDIEDFTLEDIIKESNQ